MKPTRFTAEQIVAILHEAAAGGVVRELCRRHGITETEARVCPDGAAGSASAWASLQPVVRPMGVLLDRPKARLRS